MVCCLYVHVLVALRAANACLHIYLHMCIRILFVFTRYMNSTNPLLRNSRALGFALAGFLLSSLHASAPVLPGFLVFYNIHSFATVLVRASACKNPTQ